MPTKAPDETEDTGPTREEWEGKTWLEKVNHNAPAWYAIHNGGMSQWWNGRRWCDEPLCSKDFEVVNIEHPQRIKPGCTVQPVELRIVKEDGHADSDAT